jgi:hypothetical protein
VKSQTPSTKPEPRPEGGDSKGEITNKSQIPIFKKSITNVEDLGIPHNLARVGQRLNIAYTVG